MRKSSAEHGFQEFEVSAMRRALRHLSDEKKATYEKLGTAVSNLELNEEEAEALIGKKIKVNKVAMPKNTLNKFAIKNLNMNNSAQYLSLFCFLMEEHRDILSSLIEEEEMSIKNPFVREMRKLLGHKDPVNHRYISELQGHYKLFRPFFRSPDEVMICRLSIGTPEDYYSASLEAAYLGENKRLWNESAAGKVVPISDFKSMMLLNFRNTGSIILTIDDTAKESESAVGILDGTLLISIGSHSTAYPFRAVRADPDISCGVKSIDDPEIPEMAKARFKSGFVDYPDRPKRVGLHGQAEESAP